MMGRLSRAKGAGFERTRGKLIGAWWYGAPYNLLRWAMANSTNTGKLSRRLTEYPGIAKMCERYFRRSHRSGADPNMPSDLVLPEDFPFHPELKFVNGWSLEAFALGGASGLLGDWWEKVWRERDEAARLGHPLREACLVFKRNAVPDLFMVRERVALSLFGPVRQSAGVLVGRELPPENVQPWHEPVRIVPLSALVLGVDPEALRGAVLVG